MTGPSSSNSVAPSSCKTFHKVSTHAGRCRRGTRCGRPCPWDSSDELGGSGKLGFSVASRRCVKGPCLEIQPVKPGSAPALSKRSRTSSWGVSKRCQRFWLCDSMATSVSSANWTLRPKLALLFGTGKPKQCCTGTSKEKGFKSKWRLKAFAEASHVVVNHDSWTAEWFQYCRTTSASIGAFRSTYPMVIVGQACEKAALQAAMSQWQQAMGRLRHLPWCRPWGSSCEAFCSVSPLPLGDFSPLELKG